MKIGIAGIGKGFGVDRAAEVLARRGLTDWIVDGGGDIRLSGGRAGEPWQVGIAHPRRHGRLWGRLDLSSGAVVTSGDYESYFERDGVRHHHILDPATGRPSRGTAAVTVLAPDATTADALATGLMVLGPERGLALVESLAGVEALFIASDASVTRSSGFPELRDDGSTTWR
jgi:thiamine biosynthesis lipoprotein